MPSAGAHATWGPQLSARSWSRTATDTTTSTGLDRALEAEEQRAAALCHLDHQSVPRAALYHVTPRLRRDKHLPRLSKLVRQRDLRQRLPPNDVLQPRRNLSEEIQDLPALD